MSSHPKIKKERLRSSEITYPIMTINTVIPGNFNNRSIDHHYFTQRHTQRTTMSSTDDKAPTALRICCYGSSSSRTPPKYTNAAYELGKILAKRGHTCVNGAGT